MRDTGKAKTADKTAKGADKTAAKTAEAKLTPAEVQQKAHSLWERYLMLTQELLKFIDRQDIDTFLHIVPQRGQIVDAMKALPENDYRQSAECQELLEKIKPLDMQVLYKAKAWLNKSKRQNNAVRAYDLTNAMRPTGVIFNKKY